MEFRAVPNRVNQPSLQEKFGENKFALDIVEQRIDSNALPGQNSFFIPYEEFRTIMNDLRTAQSQRQTKETSISLDLNLDGSGKTQIQTGIGFADHMLHLLSFWADFDLNLNCTGDLHIDAHHSLEDIGLTLGKALLEALDDKAGIARLGSAIVPMDESLVEVVLDLSGRPYLVYDDAPLPAVVAGEEKDIWREFFKSLAQEARMNLHIHYRYGRNGHHLVEGAFKALGMALRQAVSKTRTGVPSTKGSC